MEGKTGRWASSEQQPICLSKIRSMRFTCTVLYVTLGKGISAKHLQNKLEFGLKSHRSDEDWKTRDYVFLFFVCHTGLKRRSALSRSERWRR